jgi:pilus assembly protein CpaF
MIDDVLPIVEEEVRELVRRRGMDPSLGDLESLQRLVAEVVDDYEVRVHTSTLPRLSDRDGLQREVLARVGGLGPLQPLMDDPSVEEIWINAPGKVFCARGGRRELTNVVLGPDELRGMVERMLRSSGRRLDLSSPFVDATLLDGSRLHVVIPDITRKHWAVNIRKFVARAHTLEELAQLGSIPDRAARFLEAAVVAGLNIVVSGATQAGKTTLLNCLAAAIPSTSRVVTCEEVFELQVPLPDVVPMQTRSPNLEGQGAIDLRRLIVEALRMRPDRLIVGEVREREALDLLIALNSGLPGMTSVHANSATEAVAKLVTLPLLAGENVTHAFIVPTVASSIDLVVHLSLSGGRRFTSEIRAVSGRVESDRVETTPLWERRRGELEWTGHQPPSTDRFDAAGVDLTEVLR